MRADAMERLAAVAIAVRERRAVPSEDADLLLEAIQLIASRLAKPDRHARDRRVREIAARFYNGLSSARAAELIAARMRRISLSVAWRASLGGGSCPFQFGTVESELWSVLQDAGGKAIGVRQLRRIIGHCEGEGQPAQV